MKHPDYGNHDFGNPTTHQTTPARASVAPSHEREYMRELKQRIAAFQARFAVGDKVRLTLSPEWGGGYVGTIVKIVDDRAQVVRDRDGKDIGLFQGDQIEHV